MDLPVQDSATSQNPLLMILSGVSISGDTIQLCSVKQQGMAWLLAESVPAPKMKNRRRGMGGA